MQAISRGDLVRQVSAPAQRTVVGRSQIEATTEARRSARVIASVPRARKGLAIYQSSVETPERKLLVRVSEPTLATELEAFLRSMLHADVRERRNHVEISFAPDVDPVAELPRVERLAWVWKTAGHTNVRTAVELTAG